MHMCVMKARMSKSQVSAMRVVLFRIGAIIMIELVSGGQTVNQEHRLEVLTEHQEWARMKRPEL
jgi:hypothetical protein